MQTHKSIEIVTGFTLKLQNSSEGADRFMTLTLLFNNMYIYLFNLLKCLSIRFYIFLLKDLALLGPLAGLVGRAHNS